MSEKWVEMRKKSAESQVPPRTVTMMANLAAKMRTAKEKRRTRMFHREPCFAAGGSMDCCDVTTEAEEEERKKECA